MNDQEIKDFATNKLKWVPMKHAHKLLGGQILHYINRTEVVLDVVRTCGVKVPAAYTLVDECIAEWKTVNPKPVKEQA